MRWCPPGVSRSQQVAGARQADQTDPRPSLSGHRSLPISSSPGRPPPRLRFSIYYPALIRVVWSSCIVSNKSLDSDWENTSRKYSGRWISNQFSTEKHIISLIEWIPRVEFHYFIRSRKECENNGIFRSRYVGIPHEEIGEHLQETIRKSCGRNSN